MSDEQRVPSCWPEDEHEWGDEVSLLPHPSGRFFPGAIMSRKCVHCNVRTIRATDASVDREWLTHCWLQAVERAGGSVWDIWFEP